MRPLVGFVKPPLPVPLSLLSAITEAGEDTNLELCLDAGVSASYDGGTHWNDLSPNGHAFFLGDDGDTSNDPTFTGDVDSLDAYWSFTPFGSAKFFRFDGAEPAWISNLHKAGARFTFMLVYHTGNTTSTMRILANQTGATANVGIDIGQSDTLVSMRVSRGTAGFANTNSFLVERQSNAWNVLFVSIDEPADGAADAGIAFQARADGNHQSHQQSDTGYDAPSAAAATYPLEFCSLGNASSATTWSVDARMAAAAFWSRALTLAEMKAIYNKIRIRYGMPQAS